MLTVASVKNLKVAEKRYEVADSEVKALRVIVQPSGHKSFAVRYTHRDRDKRLTLGPVDSIPLKQARKLAADALLAVAAGRDPAGEKIEARRTAQSDMLFGTLYDRYVAEHVDRSLKPRTAYGLKSLFRKHIIPRYGRKRLSEITPHDVKAFTNSLKAAGTPTTATAVHTNLRGFFNWLNRELITSANPVQGLSRPAEHRSRDRKLDDQELGWFWRASEAMGYPFGPAFQLLLLTGARRSEVFEMTDREIRGHVWTIPAARTKNGIEHRIYLSDMAQHVINALPKLGTSKNKGPRFLFTMTGETPTSGISKAKARVDTLMTQYAGEDVSISPWVIHDLRRSFASGCGRLKPRVPLEVVERCLNHISGSHGGIVGVYQLEEYADEKRDAWQRWADHIHALRNVS